MSQRLVVIGGGVAGLAAAWAARRADPGAEVLVLEASGRVGGLVETERRQGFLIEHGPDCVVSSRMPAGLVEALGLSERLIEQQERRSAVATGHGLQPLPTGLLGLGKPPTLRELWTPLLSLRGSLRAALEPLVPTRPAVRGETAAAFVERRFGREVLDRVVTPLLRGLHGADPALLDASAALPQLVGIERERQSVLRGLVARGVAGGPGPRSLEDGMSALPQALRGALGERVRTATPVRRLRRRGEGFSIETPAGVLEANRVIVATPAHEAARLLGDLDPELGQALAAVTFTDVDQVVLGWDELREQPAPGGGFVVANAAPGALYACTWSSRKWSGRAPSGGLLARCYLTPAPGDDRDVIERALAGLDALVGPRPRPALSLVRRRRRLLPIYTPGHRERMDWAQQRAGAQGALALAGNSYNGLGLSDCLRSGIEAAQMRS